MSKSFWPVTLTPFADVANAPSVREQLDFLRWWLPQVGGRYSVIDNGDGTFTHRWDGPENDANPPQ